jgi:hypothetical protein
MGFFQTHYNSSPELFAWGWLKPLSSWSVLPEYLGLQMSDTGTQLGLPFYIVVG